MASNRSIRSKVAENCVGLPKTKVSVQKWGESEKKKSGKRENRGKKRKKEGKKKKKPFTVAWNSPIGVDLQEFRSFMLALGQVNKFELVREDKLM